MEQGVLAKHFAAAWPDGAQGHFPQPELTALREQILHWFCTGERGLSSEAMATCLAQMPPSPKPWAARASPLDIDDFRRCLLLLRAVPLARAHLPQCAALSPPWAALVAHWDTIERLYLEEAGEPQPWVHGPWARQAHELLRTVTRSPQPARYERG